MRSRSLCLLALFLGLPSPAGQLAAQAPTADTATVATIAPGVTYQNLRTSGAGGERWSIHVLRVQRNQTEVRLAAIPGTNSAGQMARALPSAMGRDAGAAGETPLAVVNGDYDLGPPYLGIPDGLSVTSGRLWTTGKLTWPAFALVGSALQPVIATPEVRLEVRAGRRRWSIGALNKPLGSGHGGARRLFTPEYNTDISSRRPVRALVIRRSNPSLPLPVNGRVRGVVADAVERADKVAIPAGSLVVADFAPEPGGASASESLFDLPKDSRVEIRFDVRVAGKKDVREAIGGFPVLVRDGRRSIEGQPSDYLSQRHPRTAVCYNRREILFVVVDGRQPFLSFGMTLEELADLMVSLGCSVAMNTDGGGSSVMAVALPPSTGNADAATGGSASASVTSSNAQLPPSSLRIVNSPSDGAERGRGNAWVILRRKSEGKEVRR